MIINNISGNNTVGHRYKTLQDQDKLTEEITSGVRISAASDDAAGLSISEKMKGQTYGLRQAARNVQDGISLIQVADGALREQESMLGRIGELILQAKNGTNEVSELEAMQAEIDELKKEITSISEKTEFNGRKLLNGDIGFELDTPELLELKKIVDKYSMQVQAIDELKELYSIIMSDEEQMHWTRANNNIVYNEIPGFMKGHGILTLNIKLVTPGYTRRFNVENLLHGLDQALKNENDYKPIVQGATTIETIENIFAGIEQVEKMTARNYEKAMQDYKDKAFELYISGELKGKLKLQVGANSGDTFPMGIGESSAKTLGITKIDITNKNGNTYGKSNISRIDEALYVVSTARGMLKGITNRLIHTISHVSTTAQNMQTAEGFIRDTEMDKTIAQLKIQNIKLQVNDAMYAQANQESKSVLYLLQ